MLNLGPIWGVDIGDSGVKAVKVKRVGEQVVLLDFQVVQYSDISGEPGTRREGMLAAALDALKAGGMGNERCFVSIAPQAVFSRFISLPPVDRRRIPEIVLYEARQQIPFSLDEVIWAYERVRKEFVPGEEIEIGLFALKREVVDAYIEELSPIRKQLHGIQVAPLALYNFIWHEMKIDEPTVVLDIGCQSTDLLIMEGDKFWLRNLPIAGNSFTSVLERKLNITHAEAEKLKLGIAESRHRRKLLEVLRPTMRDLVAEIQRSIGYYKSLAHEVKLEKVVVVGEGYRLFGLDRFLADQLQYKIERVQQLEKVPYQGAPERVEELRRLVPSLGVAVGLGLQGVGRSRGAINLLPDDFVIQRELHSKRYSGLIAAGLAWAIVACFGLKEMRALGEMRALTGAGERELQQAQRIDNALRKAESLRDKKRIDEYERMGRHREYVARVIGAIAEVIPKGFIVQGGFTYTLGSASSLRVRVEGLEPGGPEEMRGGPGGPSMLRGPGLPGGAGLPGGGGAPARRLRSDRGRRDEMMEGAGGDSLIMTFVVAAANVERDAMEKELPERLKRAAILPERLPVVKEILVTDLMQVVLPGVEKAAERDVRGLQATVHLALLLPEEVDKALAELRKAEEGERRGAEAGRRGSETATAAESAGGTERGTPLAAGVESNRASRNE